MNAKRVAFSKILASFIMLVAFVGSSAAADLSKIPRTIAKEPVYKTKPKYCLVVFGPEAKTRIWLVLDGDVLYVDRKGNSDLTDAGDRIEPHKVSKDKVTVFGGLGEGKEEEETVREFKCEAGERLLIQALQIDEDIVSIDCIAGERRIASGATCGSESTFKFSDEPQDAPIVHFDGPLTMRVQPGVVLRRGTSPNKFVTHIGTEGLGKRTFVMLETGSVPADVHPRSEFVFPGKTAGATPVTVSVQLRGRC